MRSRQVLITLIIAAICQSSGHPSALEPSLNQDENQKNEWTLNTKLGVQFWIGLNFVSTQMLTPFREIFVFVEPQHFSEANLRTVFLHLSEEFPIPEALSVTARSDKDKLERVVLHQRKLNSLKQTDRTSRIFLRSQFEDATESARLGCYRADYIRLNLNERFIYYPNPVKKEGYAVELKKAPVRFEPTEDSVSDLVRASRQGLISYVISFLDKGTDVNGRDKNGFTALFAAVMSRQHGVVELLLDRGAMVDVKGPRGWTPLMAALALSRIDDTGPTEELLRRGANVNAKGDDDETVLTLATKKGQTRIVEELLRRGVDLNAKDASGKTALIIADESRLTEISNLLRKAGATR